MMCGTDVLWTVRLQPTTAFNTVEAKYMTLATAAQECGFIRQLLFSLGIVLEKAPKFLKKILVASCLPIIL